MRTPPSALFSKQLPDAASVVPDSATIPKVELAPIVQLVTEAREESSG